MEPPPPITDRVALGLLWLRWYVRRSDESLVANLNFHADDARRLRVAEFCAQPDRFAGVRDMKTACIEHYRTAFRRGDSRA